MPEEFHENSLDASLARIIANSENNGAKLDTLLENSGDHEKRISKLEKWRFYVVGIGVGIGGAVLVITGNAKEIVLKMFGG